MSILQALVSGVSSGTIEVVDLTAPLSSETPILKLPPPFADTATFSLEEISRYDDRGPAWYWNNISHRRAHRHPPGRADPLGHRRRTATTCRRSGRSG